MILTQVIAGGAAFVLSAILAGEAVSMDHPFGYVGPVVIAVIGAISLWRAGSTRAWKETAEARAERLEDVTGELGQAREELARVQAELAIPERIEGIIRILADERQQEDERHRAREELREQQHRENLAAIAELGRKIDLVLNPGGAA